MITSTANVPSGICTYTYDDAEMFASRMLSMVSLYKNPVPLFWITSRTSENSPCVDAVVAGAAIHRFDAPVTAPIADLIQQIPLAGSCGTKGYATTQTTHVGSDTHHS